MKTITFILASLISISTFAQSVIKKDIGEFKTLKAYDLIEIEMIKSNNNRVEITGDNKKDVSIVNRNGKLKIRMKLKEILDGNQTFVKLYYTDVEVIDVNEGAKVNVSNTIKQFELKLKAQEGGTITTKTKLSYLDVKAVTGGEINVTGKSKKQDITINTGGIFDGKEFETELTNVSISAGGEAYVNASDTVDLSIKAGGDVFIYGDPKYVDESKLFGGRVKYMDK